MQRRTFLGASLSACTLGACASAQGSGAGDGYRQYYSLMKKGNHFIGDTTAFDLDFVVVPNSTQLIRYLGNKKDWSEEADPIYDNLKAGNIPAFKGQTSITVCLNLVGDHLPARLFYLNAMKCMGMVEVQRSASLRGYSQVTIPVTDGGLAELVLPRSCMERTVTDHEGRSTSVVPGVQIAARALQLPEIDSGTFKGWRNTLISKPSGMPSVSKAAAWARARKPNGKVQYLGVLFPFVVDAGESHA